ncbi:hypothetical protein [Sphingomonas sp.]|jgi:hypothetical protein|uniref:hypothetical protein n=1 Tax=Sphingomonas sp. TaxID=28214 RepID=UPI00262AB205|nr:hypothetical protein [Sphingomonas sp.]MDF2496050.1 hypothetical protein [Sphingomonas sp.]
MSALTTILLLLVAYGAIVIATTLLSQPARVRLQEIALDILDERHLSQDDRETVEWMIQSSSSSVVGLMLPFAAAYLLAGALLGARPNGTGQSKLRQNPRYDEMAGLYVASIMACSPFASLVAAPFIIAGVMLTAIRGNRSLVAAAEAPALKASAHFRQGHMQLI